MTTPQAFSTSTPPVAPANVLAALDLTRKPGTVLRTAAALAARVGSRMTVLHVLEAVSDNPKERGGHARQQLEAVARESGITTAEFVLVEGRAFEEIVRYAEQQGCDLVVMGRTGEEQGFIREALGSTVEKVARHASCPGITPNSLLSGLGLAWWLW